MSPLELQILLHYLGSAEDFHNLHCTAQRKAISDFLADDMLETCRDRERSDATYKLTPRGEFFVDFLCKLEIPRDLRRFVIDIPASETDE